MQADEYGVHPVRIARVERGLTEEELAQEMGLGVSTIRRAEQWFPLNLKTRRIICDFFQKTPKELGLLGRDWTHTEEKNLTPPSAAPRTSPQLPAVNAPVPLLHQAPPYTPMQAIDLFAAQPNLVTDEHASAWLALGTGHLAQLFTEGWSLENILNSLHVVMQVAQDMPAITRHNLLQLSGAAVMSGIALPTSEHVSEEERVRVTEALGKSIGDGWTLFQMSKIPISQVIAIAQAQLILIKQVEPLISPIDRTLFLSGIYRLIGTGLICQGRYVDSLKYNHSAHIAALESGDIWHTLQSLLCIVHSYHELERYTDAAQTIEIAFRLSEHQTDI